MKLLERIANFLVSNEAKLMELSTAVGVLIGSLIGYAIVSLVVLAIVKFAFGLGITFWQIFGALIILRIVKTELLKG